MVTVDFWKGRTVLSGNTIYRAAFMVGLFALAGVVSTKADSVTDPGTNVSYTMTSTFVLDSTGNFDVMLTIDASHFLTPDGTTTGFLAVLAVQFPGTNDAFLTLWKHSIELDPKFATAYAMLGTSYHNCRLTARGDRPCKEKVTTPPRFRC